MPRGLGIELSRVISVIAGVLLLWDLLPGNNYDRTTPVNRAAYPLLLLRQRWRRAFRSRQYKITRYHNNHTYYPRFAKLGRRRSSLLRKKL